MFRFKTVIPFFAFFISFGLQAKVNTTVDSSIEEFLKSTESTAASVAIFSGDRWVFEKHYGAAKPDSLYDLASITKVVATSSVALKILDLGWAKLSDPVSQAMPEFLKCRPNEKLIKPEPCERKKETTVDDLFRHRSGLRDVVSVEAIQQAQKDGKDPIRLFVEMPLSFGKDGERFFYADINLIVLRAWIDAVLKKHDKNYADFLGDEILKPLDMKSTFLMTTGFPEPLRLIPTSKNIKPGTIHDPIAESLGGLRAGHAGLFSSLSDLKNFSEYWIGNRKAPVLSDEIKSQALKPLAGLKPKEERGLGWDLSLFPAHKGYGHTGFTGTLVWIEPQQRVIVIILSNRTYAKPGADTYEPLVSLRTQIVDAALSKSP